MDFKLQKALICTVLLHLICPVNAGNFNATVAGTLRTALTTGYDTFVRPLDTTLVYIQFGMTHINTLDIVDQQFNVNGFFMIHWNDSRLEWTAVNYDNMTEIYMTMSSIWMPPVVLNNAAGAVEILSDSGDVGSNPIALYSTGALYWLAPVSFSVQCTIDIQYYPFDIQTCTLFVTPWMYNSQQLQLYINNPAKITTELYEENGEWDLKDSNVEVVDRSLHGFTFTCVKFEITLKRKYSYYLMNMVLPVVFLSILGALVFVLPIESGGQNGYAMTILLSLAVVMTMVSDSVPPTSSSTCILSVNLLITFIVVAFEVIITVVNLKIYNLKHLGYIPSPFMQRFMRKHLVNISRYERACDIDKKEKINKTKLSGNSKVCIAIDNLENDKITDNVGVNKAWKQESDKDKNAEEEIPYTYEDLSTMLNTICFVFFLALTILLDIMFLLILMIGGGNSG